MLGRKVVEVGAGGWRCAGLLHRAFLDRRWVGERVARGRMLRKRGMGEGLCVGRSGREVLCRKVRQGDFV